MRALLRACLRHMYPSSAHALSEREVGPGEREILLLPAKFLMQQKLLTEELHLPGISLPETPRASPLVGQEFAVEEP